MVTALTKGIKISVETQFQPELTDIMHNLIYFKYHITIENHNDFTVQLIHRHWIIYDTHMMKRNVSGAGVVGKKPILVKGNSFAYQSGCELYAEFGYMRGVYDFAVLNANNETVKYMQVSVPRFKLEFPPRLN
jgi:ApaG protein